ncbi:MAG: YigZ family protein [Lachnospiraceae bacterium]|nr:YigZ family protein [Lachnospiraceae bacterium]
MSKLIRYTTVAEGGQGEIVEKKSRFIATVRPVSSEEEAISFIDEMKKKYWDARHNCSAYSVGITHPIQRCSDDGEPGQTAGRPMMDVLNGAGLTNVCVVVTRYFGGVLLGTGGLIRAYTAATKAGLDASLIMECIPGYHLKITCDYTLVGKLQYLIASEGLSCLSTDYTDVVTMTVAVPSEDLPHIQSAVTEATNARVSMDVSNEIYL